MLRKRAFEGPPRARLAFRVGVVGHRPNRLPQSSEGILTIRARLEAILDAVVQSVEAFSGTGRAALYSPAPAIFRALSSLADGTDQLFAEAALGKQFELCVPLPFPLAEFEKDFTAQSDVEGSSAHQTFKSLLDRASNASKLTLFELDGARDNEAEAYRAAGKIILNQSDLLVAVWDGEPAQGRGGTLDTLREAVSFGVPVVCIDAGSPHGWMLISRVDDLEASKARFNTDAETLPRVVKGIVENELAIPQPKLSHTESRNPRDQSAVLADTYFGERRPNFNFFILWRIFYDLVGDHRLRIPPLRIAPFDQKRSGEWTDDADASSNGKRSVVAWINDHLWRHFAWADGLATYYADAHRSSFLATSFLAAAAVFAALGPVALAVESSRSEIMWILLEATILTFLLITIGRAKAGRWHQRRLEYRMLAEWLRLLRLLLPLGGGRPLPRTPAHLAVYGDPMRSWMYWQLRAVAREAGIPSASCTLDYAAICLLNLRKTIGDELQGQAFFHRVTTRRYQRISTSLHRGTTMLLWLTIACIALNFGFQLSRATIEHSGVPLNLLLFAAAGFPALSAALANINNQGEFARLAKRAHAMSDAFGDFRKQIRQKLTRLRSDNPPSMAEITELASEMASSMVEEVADWRIVGFDLPHAPE
jgi:hypothetical protein